MQVRRITTVPEVETGCGWNILPCAVSVDGPDIIFDEFPGDLGHYACPIPGVVVRRASTTVLHAPKGLACLQETALVYIAGLHPFKVTNQDCTLQIL